MENLARRSVVVGGDLYEFADIRDELSTEVGGWFMSEGQARDTEYVLDLSQFLRIASNWLDEEP
jgi:hypothetical protein